MMPYILESHRSSGENSGGNSWEGVRSNEMIYILPLCILEWAMLVIDIWLQVSKWKIANPWAGSASNRLWFVWTCFLL
jgi:hypothetical protein